LNPAEVNESGSSFIFPLLYSCLFVPDASGILQPDLAETWTYDPKNFTWTIHLRKDALFHNGHPVTSEDIRYTIKLALKNIRPSFFALIEKIALLSETSFIIHLNKSDNQFLNKIWDMEIIHKPRNEKIHNSTHSVSSGPFRFENRNQENMVSLKANKDYYLGQPLLDGITFYYQQDKEKSWTRLLAGKTDIAQGITPKNYEITKQYENRFYFEQRIMGFYSILLYNTYDPLFSDIKVRKALTLAINREYIVNKILNGYGEVAIGPLGVDSPYHNPDLFPMPYNPEKALKFLDQAGWSFNKDGHYLFKDGKTFEFTILVFKEHPIKKKIAQYIKLCLNDVGIKVRLQSLPYKELMRRYRKNNEFQAVLTDFTDARRFIESLKKAWSPDKSNKAVAGCFEDPEVTRLLARAISEQDTTKQKALLHKADTLIASLQPGTFLYHKKVINVMSKRFFLRSPFSLHYKGIYRLRHASLNRE